MRPFTFAILLFLSLRSSSQKVVDVSKEDSRVGSNTFFVSGGEPFVTTKFVNLVEGSPYFKEEWMKGVVVDASDHQFKNVRLRIDLMANTIHFIGDKEQEFVAKNPVKQVVLTDDSGNNYRFDHSIGLEGVTNAAKDKWYMWLASGTASLYKKFEKDLTEFRPYGSSTIEQRIKTHEKYLVLYKNSFHEIKKIKDVPSVLEDKKKELEEFLKTRDDEKAQMDERMVNLVEYYNSLMIKKDK
ncbi:MAG: hypothetical protein ACXVBJ_14860 [Flavisolibacter sp.]